MTAPAAHRDVSIPSVVSETDASERSRQASSGLRAATPRAGPLDSSVGSSPFPSPSDSFSFSRAAASSSATSVASMRILTLTVFLSARLRRASRSILAPASGCAARNVSNSALSKTSATTRVTATTETSRTRSPRRSATSPTNSRAPTRRATRGGDARSLENNLRGALAQKKRLVRRVAFSEHRVAGREDAPSPRRGISRGWSRRARDAEGFGGGFGGGRRSLDRLGAFPRARREHRPEVRPPRHRRRPVAGEPRVREQIRRAEAPRGVALQAPGEERP